MTKWDIINFLIMKYQYELYLEIGLCNCNNWKRIRIKNKVGVDPVKTKCKDGFIFIGTSNAFFENNNLTFDIIFIDGDHHADQVYRDIQNSLLALNYGGTIVCHDLNPWCEFLQKPSSEEQKGWTGDCWKAWIKIRRERNDLNMKVVDTDSGCGIIQKGHQELIIVSDKDIVWSHFAKNKEYLLNLISSNKFLCECVMYL